MKETVFPYNLYRYWYIKLLTAIILLAGIVWLYLYDPQYAASTPPCIFKKLTGFDCAGCGTARACYQLLHGHIAKAANYNILLLFFIPFFIAAIYKKIRDVNFLWIEKLYQPNYVLWIVVIFWIVRNIPAYPFYWLSSDR